MLSRSPLRLALNRGSDEYMKLERWRGVQPVAAAGVIPPIFAAFVTGLSSLDIGPRESRARGATLDLVTPAVAR